MTCERLFADLVGAFDADAFRYFFGGDGEWFKIDSPEKIFATPIGWRPA